MRKKHRDAEPRSLNPRFWLRLILFVILLLALFLVPLCCCEFANIITKEWFQMLVMTLVLCLVVTVCSKLTDIFSLRKKEGGITWCQIAILIAAVLWVIGVIVIFDIKEDSNYFLAIGIVGTMLGWIFQETLKGVVAFIHVRMNHLLNIDDWIQIPNYNVDGKVKHITLTTVTIYNWDTTTSSIPTSLLQSDHFINLQKMVEGKTFGRLVKKVFYLDIDQLRPITSEEAEKLKNMTALQHLLPEEEIHEGAFNAHLYRLYIYHWLMNNPSVSQMPRLMVSWQEHTVSGLALEVHFHIMNGGYSSFEWQQSSISEHIIEALDWFGLRLYQKDL